MNLKNFGFNNRIVKQIRISQFKVINSKAKARQETDGLYFYTSAITSTSTRTFLGRVFTATQERRINYRLNFSFKTSASLLPAIT